MIINIKNINKCLLSIVELFCDLKLKEFEEYDYILIKKNHLNFINSLI